MATLLYRLGKTAFRRWPLFLVVWLVAMAGVGTFAATMSRPMTDSFSIPGIPSERAADLQAELFPGAVDAFDQASVNVVVAAPAGHTLTERKYAAAVDRVVADLGDLPQMPATELANPAQTAAAQRAQLVKQSVKAGATRAQAEVDARTLSPLSRDERVGVIGFAFDVETIADVRPATIAALHDVLESDSVDGLTVEANGAGATGQPELGGSSERSASPSPC